MMWSANPQPSSSAPSSGSAAGPLGAGFGPRPGVDHKRGVPALDAGVSETEVVGGRFDGDGNHLTGLATSGPRPRARPHGRRSGSGPRSFFGLTAFDVLHHCANSPAAIVICLCRIRVCSRTPRRRCNRPSRRRRGRPIISWWVRWTCPLGTRRQGCGFAECTAASPAARGGDAVDHHAAFRVRNRSE
jgi:hypothetical protein